jgi:hypothetical protein
MVTTLLSPEAQALQAAIDQLSLPMSERDPEAVRQACEQMDRMREELRAKFGTMEVAVELIREARDP